jgi:SAM-dependent methyltransferase
MIKKIHSVLKTHGISGLLCILYRRVFPYRLACYQHCKPLFQSKIGLEIGGVSSIFKRSGSLPVYAGAARIDNCNFGHQTIWEGTIKEGATFHYDKRRAPGNQYIAEATNLSHIAPAFYDFVLSSHTLEHVANPLQALSEWTRVLKEKGLLVLVVPHRDGTFDHRRPVTSLAHIIKDFEQQITEGDMTHLEEILRLHDLSKDVASVDFEAFKQRSKRNLENRCLHHHVFDTRLTIEVIHHMGLQILAVEVFRPYHILVVAQKTMRGQEVQNDIFRGIHTTPSWLSPFPSDHISTSNGITRCCWFEGSDAVTR